MLGFPCLTETPDEQKLTAPGMAYFADTGPFGKTCGDCKFKGYRRRVVTKAGEFVKTIPSQGCAKFRHLTGRHGPAINGRLRACKYFEDRGASP
jgi:hypothetical protein